MKRLYSIKMHTRSHSDDPDVCYRIATAYKRLNRIEDAIEYYRLAYTKRPSHLPTIIALANALSLTHNYQEALELYIEALEIRPHLVSALHNAAFTLNKLGRHDEAITIYEETLTIHPDHAKTHFNLAMLYLALGNFEKGLPEYEWRWAAYHENPRKFSFPEWDGSNPAGKTIVLYAEQGLGDTLQFVRYAQKIHNMGATVVVHTQNALYDILQLCPFIDTIITGSETIPYADAQCALMSAPYKCKTQLDSIPNTIPYIYPKPELIHQWKNYFSSNHDFKIGICWQGNMNYQKTSLKRAVAEKSLHLELFEPLNRIPGVSLYSLQKIGGTDQIKKIQNTFTLHTFNEFDEHNGRFMDTAAIMKNLDLIITVDTATAHLAGSLGVPVWTLLPYHADWRWMKKINYTPWYPTMRLFRQKNHGDWYRVIQEITDCLKILLPQKTVYLHQKGKHDTV